MREIGLGVGTPVTDPPPEWPSAHDIKAVRRAGQNENENRKDRSEMAFEGAVSSLGMNRACSQRATCPNARRGRAAQTT